MVAEVVRALMELCEASRQERVARLAYKGPDFSIDGAGLLKTTAGKREAFEKHLDRFIEILVRA